MRTGWWTGLAEPHWSFLFLHSLSLNICGNSAISRTAIAPQRKRALSSTGTHHLSDRSGNCPNCPWHNINHFGLDTRGAFIVLYRNHEDAVRVPLSTRGGGNMDGLGGSGTVCGRGKCVESLYWNSIPKSSGQICLRNRCGVFAFMDDLASHSITLLSRPKGIPQYGNCQTRANPNY